MAGTDDTFAADATAPSGEGPSNEATFGASGTTDALTATALAPAAANPDGAADGVQAEQADLTNEWAQALTGFDETETPQLHQAAAAPAVTSNDDKAPEQPTETPAQPRDQLDELLAPVEEPACVPQETNFPSPDGKSMMRGKSPLSMSTPALGSYADLKAKTHFDGATHEGVLKRTTYMTSISNYRTGAKYSLGIRCGASFVRISANPAPGTYNTPNEDKTKYIKPPSFSFGGVSRFGMGGEAPSKKMPGPGAYTPSDPSLSCQPKVGFGTSVRGKGSLVAQANPGPGAYEQRSTVGQGPMCTAGGRHATSYMRARSLPGPGSYNPSMHYAYPTLPRCGFGTSTRDDIAGRARNLVQPGPGTYEMQNHNTVGTDAPKFSATSRRRVHDLNSYVTPGPGTYNAHATSFGY